MIRVAILEDHQSVVDGYLHRLSQVPGIVVVDARPYGLDLEEMLEEHVIDVLLLDIHVPTSSNNQESFPVLDIIPGLLMKYSHLNILVISMFDQAALVNAAMDCGAAGYILKDDYHSIEQLGRIINVVSSGGVYFSKRAFHQLTRKIPFVELPSPRQLEALTLSATFPDATADELAERLKISPSTVRNLLSGTYRRLGVSTRTEAIFKAKRFGLLSSFDEEPEEPGLSISSE